MSYETLLYEIDGPVLTVTLNRPDKLNAYTAVMGAELEDAFLRADADDAVRAIVVTGAGRGFCAGADISSGAGAFDTKAEGSVAFAAPNRPRSSGGAGFVGAIFNCRKPSIAAINGAAVGVGATLTLPMDIRIAAESARFGFVFGRVGIVPEAASSWFLPRVVGISQAMEWVATGRVFDAQEALRGRLVSRVVPDADLLPTAYALAAEIVANTSAVAVGAARRLLWSMLGAPTPWDATGRSRGRWPSWVVDPTRPRAWPRSWPSGRPTSRPGSATSPGTSRPGPPRRRTFSRRPAGSAPTRRR